ncbi:MAG: orc1/cdc6 family replication initiation protein [Nanoarchaeota archaeon]
MEEKGLVNFFEQFLNKRSLFTNKAALQSSYAPGNIPHRDIQISQVANVLAPALKGEKPSNLFIYGKTGTGKTLVVKYTTDQIASISQQRTLPVKIVYINCKLKKVADTEYRLVAQLSKEFGKDVPPTGLPTDEVYRIFFSALDRQKQIVILVLDEIDELIGKAGDELLYNLTRINQELKLAQISIVGISNDLSFTDNLDPRVKSSLSEEELVFAPYDALQLQDILRARSSVAFRQDGVEFGVIEKCAARAANDNGDARRALELLRVAGELADRTGAEKLGLQHLDQADETIEKDRMLELIRTQPKQHQATLYAIVKACKQKKEGVFTGEIYDVYQTVCEQTKQRPLTQRRVSDIIAEFDMLGLITAKVISKGRYGRTREISLAIPSQNEQRMQSLLEEGLSLA